MNTLLRLCAVLIPAALLWTHGAAESDEFASETISVGVVVSDLEKSLEFYTKVIGMKKTGTFTVNADMARRTGLTGGVPVDITVLRLGDGKAATDWKLMSFAKPAVPPRKQHIQDDTGPQYITIQVKALKPFLSRIREHNVKLLGDTPVSIGGTTQFVLVQDPDGTFVELIGPME